MASAEIGTKKRKRTKNTTIEQYEIYIQFLENDYVFRSGIINPTLEENYLLKKWQELSALLNAVGDGPHMGAEEWKKRFVDWKYSVRAKARKIIEHQNKTGSGPQTELKLTQIEDEALSLWGKISITGTPLINSYDGLTQTESTNILSIEDMPVVMIDLIECSSLTQKNSATIENKIEEPTSLGDKGSVAASTPKRTLSPQNKFSKVRHRPKPLSALAEKLINVCDNNDHNTAALTATSNTFCTNYMKYKNERLDLERNKFNFELAKYKFENPGFHYLE